MHTSPRRDPVTRLYPEQVEFIDWLVDPDREGTQNQWARDHDLSGSTVAKWKKDDPHFIAALNERLAQVQMDPLSFAEVIQVMRTKAIKHSDVQAAKLVFDYLKWLNPGDAVGVDRDASEYSDAELLALAAELTQADTPAPPL